MVDKRLNYGREIIERFLQHSGAFETALDLGAGWGADLEAAARVRPEARLFGVELNPDCAARLASMGVRVSPLDLERSALHFQDGRLDIIIANQILEHAKELFWIMHEVSRTLAVGGQLIIGVPNLASFHNRVSLALGRQPTCIQSASAHVRGFTRGDLHAFVQRCFSGGYVMRE